MPRNIKTLIKGLTDSPIIKEDWDITPITETTTPDITFTQLSNCNSVGEQIVVDITGVTGTEYVSAVKTNITMQTLETDKTIKIGLIADDIPLSAPCLVGIYVAPASLTATQAKNEVYNTFFSGQPLINNRIMHYVLSFGSSYQATTTYRIPNAATPNGVVGILGNTVPGIADLEIGSKTGLLLSRRNNNLYIGRFDVHSDGVQYDLNGTEAVVNGPVLANSMTVFYISLVADQGSGLQNLAYTPSVTLSPPSYDITGTSVEAAGPPDSTDWVNFANPVRPSYTSILQATLPTDVRIGQFYRVTIDPSYTGIDPTPYGYPLKNNQTVLINSITGAGNITAYVDNESLIELTNDILEPVSAQQALLTQTVTDLGILLQQTQEDVNVALLNTESLVVYVKDSTLVPSNPDMLFSTSVSFDNFHAAYSYLLTLPKFIKKTIVIDDRGGANIGGDEVTVYELIENNITLSTYTRFIDDHTGITPNTSGIVLTIDCTGLRLNKFEGVYNKFSVPIPSGIIPESTVPVLADIGSRISLGNDSSLIISDNAVSLNIYNSFRLGERSNLTLHLYGDIINEQYTPLYFYRGRDSSITVTGGIFYQHPNYTNFIELTKPFDNAQDSFDFSESNISVAYTDTDPLHDANNYRIIRTHKDLGAQDAFGSYNLYAGGGGNGYLFAKSLDLYEGNLRVPDGISVKLLALPGVVISNNGVKPVLQIDGPYGECIDEGVHFSLGASGGTNVPIIQNSGKYYRTGGKVTGNKLFTSYPAHFYSNNTDFHLCDVDHYPHPSYAGIVEGSNIGAAADLFIRNLRVMGLTGNIPIVTLNINSLGVLHNYRINGVYVKRNNVVTNGIVNIVNAYGKDSVTITDTISVKNINIIDSNDNIAQGPLITKDGLPFAYYDDPVFDYDGKKLLLEIYGATGNGGGGPVLLTSPKKIERGFYVHPVIPEYFRFLSRKSGKQFRYRLRANIYRTSASGNAEIGIKSIDASTNQVTGSVVNFTLPAANTRVPIDVIVIGPAPAFLNSIFIHAAQVPSTGQSVFFEDVEFTVHEI